MQKQKFYPTIVISDVHLGTEHSKTEQLAQFLRTVNCNTLILNGDIIDGWQLQKGGRNQSVRLDQCLHEQQLSRCKCLL